MSLRFKIIYWCAAILISITLLLNSVNDMTVDFSAESWTVEDTVAKSGYVDIVKAGTYDFNVMYESAHNLFVTIYEDEVPLLIQEISAGNGEYTLEFETTKPSDIQIVLEGIADAKLGEWSLSSERPIYNDAYYLTFLFVVGAAFLFILLLKREWLSQEQRYLYLFAMVGLIIFSSYPTFSPYLLKAHDMDGFLLRIEGIKDALRDGQFPVAIYPRSYCGYGVVSSVYPDLFLYPAAILRLCGVSIPLAYHSLITLVNSFGIITAFFAVRSVTKNSQASLFAMVLFALSSYRLANVYIRGAIPETIAITFMLIAITGLYHIFIGEQKKWYLLAIGYTGIINSHVLTCFMIVVVSVLWGLLFIKELFQEKRWQSLLKSLLLTIGVNCGVLYSLLHYRTEVDRSMSSMCTDFASLGVNLGRLFQTMLLSSSIGDEPVWHTVGIACIFCIGIVAGFFLKKECDSKTKKAIGGLLGIVLLFLYMSTSLFPWETFVRNPLINKITSFIQFPWRMEGVFTVCLVVCVGLAISKMEFCKRYRKELFVLLLVMSFCSAYQLLDETYNTAEMIERSESGFGRMALGEYSPNGTSVSPTPVTVPAASGANVSIAKYEKEGTYNSFYYASPSEGGYVDIPVFSYSGYHAYYEEEDGSRTEAKIGRSEDETGRIRVYLEKSETPRKVVVAYEGLKAAKLLMLMPLISMILVVVIYKRK